MKSNVLFAVVITILCFSCSINSDNGSYIDLGDGFKYVKEYPQAIIYSTSNESPSSGKYIVAPIVTSYGVYKNNVFAISREELSIPTKRKGLYGKPKYWIINKEEVITKLKPVDSTFFFSEINKLNLKLCE